MARSGTFTMRAQPELSPSSVLGRTLLILGAFTSDRSRLKVSEIVAATGLPRPTIYRLTAQMEAAGLLERDGSYMTVGLRLFEMGQLAPRQRELRECCQPYMEDLREATRETVHLAIPAGAEVVYIDKLAGPAGPSLPSRVGGRMPAYCTGVGKALLAYQPEPVIRKVLAAGLWRRTPYSICTPGHLLRELQEVRLTGLAYEREESTIGVICVASPIVCNGMVVAAISISGWTYHLEIKRVSAAVKSAALAVSRELGRVSRGSRVVPESRASVRDPLVHGALSDRTAFAASAQ